MVDAIGKFQTARDAVCFVVVRFGPEIDGVCPLKTGFVKGGFYVGVSSLEEGSSIEKCCTFRGSIAKLNVHSGAIMWQTFMLPNNNGKLGGYAGAVVWGSSPSIDIGRKLVYIATGNLYSAPSRIEQCQAKQNKQSRPTQPDPSNCPPGPNPDAHFEEAPMLLSVHINGTKRDIAVAVQKSGIAWALDRGNGDLIYFTEAGPGGIGGGGTWGAATDEKIVYTNIANSGGKNFTLKPSNKITTAGGWVAIYAKTGMIKWSIENPSNATASGPVTVASGVVFVGSTNGQGT
ncbi:hypothetical protein Nepgr_006976 [Nepenthes gracilis]|uniref:Uncharacterized protein n=1 Tax=Nepenthes gracilis TaxID=150966 RepID=A0AAD3S6K3_NEPGR|nr:hypothetical protein Nepgr_006976 [Nepenthes gracilis]